MDENQKFEEITNKRINDFFRRNPSAGAFVGKPEYEKDVEPGTKEHLEENLAFFAQWLDELKQLDIEKLSLENRFTIEGLKYRYDLSVFRHEVYPLWNRIPNGLGAVQGVIFIVFQRKGPTIEVAETIIARLNKLERYVNEFQSRFDDSPIPKVWQDLALMQTQSTPQFLDFLISIFSNTPNIPETLQNELAQTIEQVKPIIQTHVEWIQSLPVDDSDFAWALEAEKFDELLRLRKLPWDRETILKKGYDLLKSLKIRAEEVAKEIDPTKTYKEVIEDLKADHPPTFEMVLEHTRSEAERANEYVKTHDLATIPEDDRLAIVETPPYLAPIIPFAAYSNPPYFDRTQPGIYLVTPTKDEEGLKRHFYADISNTMVHEAYPGHHLDFACNNAFLPFIQTFGSAPETVEGWAHYCEEMMLQQGFHEDLKKAELVIIKDQIWRAVRIIVDIELHCKQRTMEDAVKMLIEEAQMDQKPAQAEVLRYTTAPAYQLSYLIGKLLIDDLKREVKEQMGEKFSLKFFHDTILQSGGVPYFLLKQVFEEKVKGL